MNMWNLYDLANAAEGLCSGFASCAKRDANPEQCIAASALYGVSRAAQMQLASWAAERTLTHFAVGNVATREGWTTTRLGPAWPADGGWNEQDVTGSHGTILYSGPEADRAQRVLCAWLENVGS